MTGVKLGESLNTNIFHDPLKLKHRWSSTTFILLSREYYTCTICLSISLKKVLPKKKSTHGEIQVHGLGRSSAN